ncbi:MAG: HEAT repeat domain-containing protein [Candidatus Muiribacteriota bacterium]
MVEFINQFFIDIESPDPEIRKNAIIKFSKEMLYSLQALEDVKLSEKDEKVRYYATRTLQMFKEKITEFSELEKMEKEEETNVTENDFDFDTFLELLKSQSTQTKLKAIQRGILTFDSKLILPYLKEALFREQDSYVVSSLVKSIGYIGNKNEINILVKYLNDPDPRVRANTIEGLEFIKEEEIYKHLIPMLKDKNPRVIANAAKALQKFGKSNVLDLLAKMITLPKREMRDSAIFALSKMKSIEAGKILLNHYKNEQELELISKIEKAVENMIAKGEESLNHLYLEAKKEKQNIIKETVTEKEEIPEIEIEPEIKIEPVPADKTIKERPEPEKTQTEDEGLLSKITGIFAKKSNQEEETEKHQPGKIHLSDVKPYSEPVHKKAEPESKPEVEPEPPQPVIEPEPSIEPESTIDTYEELSIDDNDIELLIGKKENKPSENIKIEDDVVEIEDLKDPSSLKTEFNINDLEEINEAVHTTQREETENVIEEPLEIHEIEDVQQVEEVEEIEDVEDVEDIPEQITTEEPIEIISPEEEIINEINLNENDNSQTEEIEDIIEISDDSNLNLDSISEIFEETETQEQTIPEDSTVDDIIEINDETPVEETIIDEPVVEKNVEDDSIIEINTDDNLNLENVNELFEEKEEIKSDSDGISEINTDNDTENENFVEEIIKPEAEPEKPANNEEQVIEINTDELEDADLSNLIIEDDEPIQPETEEIVAQPYTPPTDDTQDVIEINTTDFGDDDSIESLLLDDENSSLQTENSTEEISTEDELIIIDDVDAIEIVEATEEEKEKDKIEIEEKIVPPPVEENPEPVNEIQQDKKNESPVKSDDPFSGLDL